MLVIFKNSNAFLWQYNSVQLQAAAERSVRSVCRVRTGQVKHDQQRCTGVHPRSARGRSIISVNKRAPVLIRTKAFSAFSSRYCRLVLCPACFNRIWTKQGCGYADTCRGQTPCYHQFFRRFDYNRCCGQSDWLNKTMQWQPLLQK